MIFNLTATTNTSSPCLCTHTLNLHLPLSKEANELHEANGKHATSDGADIQVTALDLVVGNSNKNQTTLTQQGFWSSSSQTEDDEADIYFFAQCAGIQASKVFSFIGLPETPECARAIKEAVHAHSMKWTHSVDEFPPGNVPLDLGAETYKMQIADALRHNEPVQPFTSNIVSHLKARRAKGTKRTEDEMLADAERFPWEFVDEPSSDEESGEESDDGKPPAKNIRSD